MCIRDRAVLIRRTEKTVVTLCADTITDDSGEYGRFAPAIRTAARLRELAREYHVPVAKIRLLTENHRAADQMCIRDRYSTVWYTEKRRKYRNIQEEERDPHA